MATIAEIKQNLLVENLEFKCAGNGMYICYNPLYQFYIYIRKEILEEIQKNSNIDLQLTEIKQDRCYTYYYIIKTLPTERQDDNIESKSSLSDKFKEKNTNRKKENDIQGREVRKENMREDLMIDKLLCLLKEKDEEIKELSKEIGSLQQANKLLMLTIEKYYIVQ